MDVMESNHELARAEPLGPKRARVLALLQDAGEPMTAPEVAARLDIHGNTARFHLDALVDGGLVVRSAQARSTPGRPRMLFEVSPTARAKAQAEASAQRSYPLLAEMLAGFLADQLPEAQGASERAGVSWGRYLTEPRPPFHRSSESEAVETLVESLDKVGFDSHVVTEGDDLRLEINHCPFLEVANRHRDVVCALHLGLIRGVLEQSAAPLSAESLEPLVEPSRCIAHLRRAPAAS